MRWSVIRAPGRAHEHLTLRKTFHNQKSNYLAGHIQGSMNFIEFVINFIQNNFEPILYVLLVIWTCLSVMALILRFREWIFVKPIELYKQVAFRLIFCALVGFTLLAGYIYWVNYERPSPVTFEDRLLPTTAWVESPLTIYFILDKELLSIHTNSRHLKTVYKADAPIREYHFSPDGRWMLIVTAADLLLFNRQNQKAEVVDSLQHSEAAKTLRGVIQFVRWAPDSQKFAFEITRWSEYGSQVRIYIYNLKDQDKRYLNSPLLKKDELYWDLTNEHLYYTHTVAKDPAYYSYPYEIWAYQIPLATLESQFLFRILSEESEFPKAHMTAHGIELFTQADRLSFGTTVPKSNEWISSEGPRIGIDEYDHLYFIKNRWWRRRLYAVPRVPLTGNFPRYPYEGLSAIHHVRWLPGGRYVILGHRTLGILILEPATGRIGQLIDVKGKTFGWFKEETI